ncbi:phosphoribosyl pyrophosphate synthase-associated protein 2-like [Xenia sp. Carnegie-2017]|uniref:phosphoribosyl pyrophosphate synthase-associated protein 2-like n=1 Tax=Xenia sp. Carnegie-2017 TaxID=2897299 RepID=UPI001F035EFD|nr:phosphoribosyl pyrophosphate synthase-associated protein 2-like [Xenia sp. Carnegie-2017]XP_046856713.1 phosphoribosyl pyrophosphate synthase-associated protein 2-like [Xenia sp. Carnegie-2017]
MASTKPDFVIFALNSNKDLAEKIASRLEMPLSDIEIGKQSGNEETKVNMSISVRGKDVFILQSGSAENINVNDALMELLITCYACKTSSAKKIIAVVPYLPYSKQSKMRNRGSIPSRLVADLLCVAGLSGLITMDLHSKEIQGFFKCPVDNLRASPFIVQYIQEIPDYRNAVIVSKNPQAASRATSFAERLHLGLAVIHGVRQEAESEACDGRTSPPPQKKTFTYPLPGNMSHLGLLPKEKPPMNVVGDVSGKIAIIIDDMIDTVEPFSDAASLLKERGAYKVYVMVTHGILSGDCVRLIEESNIDEVVVTNTVEHQSKKLQCTKIKTIDVSVLLAEAVRRIHNGESMSYLFRNVPLQD